MQRLAELQAEEEEEQEGAPAGTTTDESQDVILIDSGDEASDDLDVPDLDPGLVAAGWSMGCSGGVRRVKTAVRKPRAPVHKLTHNRLGEELDLKVINA